MLKKNSLIATLLMCVLTQAIFADVTPETPENIRKSASNYEYGRDGVKQNYLQAFALYCQAALKGDVESAYNLGFMYFNGRGVKRDASLAVRWFKQASDGGDFYAKQMLTRFQGVAPIDDIACKPVEPELKLVAESNPNKQMVEGWVNQIAPRYGIDPQLVMAVIRAESAFNPNALSSKNAQGLMQLIPETAERFGVKDSWNPIQNIKGGTAYLHWLLRHFEGKVEWVLAAYNAGEAAVERYKGIPPYLETQNYVRQILLSYPRPIHPVPPEKPEKFVVVDQKI